MKTKTFDCVEMKRQGARATREKLANLTPEEQLAYWQERSRMLRQRQQAAGSETAGG